MFEDSISCSPGNDNKSSGSRSRRFHKNTKRKSQRLSGAQKGNFSAEVPCLEALYEGSSPALTQYEHFNPFENEIILAAADIALESTSRTKLNNLTSQGFVKLESLPVWNDNEENSSIPPDHRGNFVRPQPSALTVQTICGPETQFGITESEFVRFCDEVEIDVEGESQPATETKTPKAKKSIVDAILEDFCGSPYSESPPKFIADDNTPIFRFKSKSIRTYSNLRKKKPRRNIVNELASALLPDDDGNASDSSGLSVQEDLSQNVVPELDTVDLNNSVRVCENLLNLSSYFSQIASYKKSSAISEKNEESTLNAIVEDIIKIKRKSFTINRIKSLEEFHGFSDSDNEDALKDLLEDEDDILQQINCDSLCYEKIVPKSSFEYNCSEIESALESVNAVIKEADKLISSIHDPNAEEETFSTKRQPSCDKQEDILHNSSDKLPPNDEQLFDDFDLWHDTECLLNYKTQQPHSHQGKPGDSRRHPLIDNTSLRSVSEEHEGILTVQTTSMKTYNKKLQITGVSSSTHIEEVDQIRNILQTTSKQPMSTTIASTVQGFSTASKKPIAISEEAKRKAEAILTKFEQEEINQRIAAGEIVKTNSRNCEEQDTISTTRQTASVGENFFDIRSAFKKPLDKSSASTCLGFSTASKKPIALSDEAMRKADAILTKFEQEEFEQRVAADKLKRGVLEDDTISTIKKLEENPSNLRSGTISLIGQSSVPTFQGFSTASTKPIAIFDEAKRKSDEICSSTLEINKDPQNISFQQFPSVSTTSAFVGFSTASKKPITVSDVARRKAGEFLKNFEQTEKEERREEVFDDTKQKAQELLMDIEFFEEAFEEELKILETHPIASINAMHSRTNDCKTYVSSNKPIFDGFKTASKKSIQISEDAKRHADQLLRTVQNEDLPQDFLNCIQDNLSDVSSSNPAGSSIRMEEQVDGASKDPTELVSIMSIGKSCLHTKRTSLADLDGRNTAFKNSVKFSEEPAAEHLLRNVNKKYPLDIFERKKEFSRLHEINEESDSSSQEYEITESLKRKRNIFFTEDLRNSPALISPRRLSYNERTPLNCMTNAVLHKCSSLPQMKCSSRKNLLSLSKRKKFNSPGRVDDACTGPKTPEKVHQPFTSQYNANVTPNLKEFFDSVSTSTPRLIRKGESKIGKQLVKDSSIDTDFRQINWEDANNSGRVCRTSSFTDPNVTCSEVSPSPKQRIERLKMYGEPPPISPILTVNKCRPSGLRRGRSLLKP